MKKEIILSLAALVILIASGFLFSGGNSIDNNLQVIFLDVGQGDSHLIMAPGGQNILIDGGPDNTVLEKLSLYLPLGDRTIDLMILTHPHADHAAGLVEVLKRYNIKRVLATGVVYTTDTYLAWLNEIKEQGIQFDQAVAGRQYIFESKGNPVVLKVLYPDRNVRDEEFDDLNESSVVVMLEYLGRKFLFTGDVSVDNEKRILNNYCHSDLVYPEQSRREEPPVYAGSHTREIATTSRQAGTSRNDSCQVLKADVLKVPHQGSDTSSSEEFISAVQPEYAVIPVGENDYGHPNLRIIRRLERAGAQVLRTDQAGDISFFVDDSGNLEL